MKEALFYQKLTNQEVRCLLCPQGCRLKNNETGFCGVRKNINGKLFTLTSGYPVSLAIDPIEKKPLFHFLPGSKTFSLGTFGCNFKCKHCQNWEISQEFTEEQFNFLQYYSPSEIVSLAKKNNCQSIAFTYNEPTVFYEYMLDIAKIAKKEKLKTVMVSNGYINPQPLKELLPYIDAFNIDLKSFSEEFYQKISSAHLKPVLTTLKTIFNHQKWLEITTLIIPTYNDDLSLFKEMLNWITTNLTNSVPLHLTRFYPHYQLNQISPTSLTTLEKLYQLAKEKLKYVYLGNILTEKENTYCPQCNTLLIKRESLFNTKKMHLNQGKCPNCNTLIEGVWK